MARTNPLGKVKDVTAGALKMPVSAAGSVIGLVATAAGRARREVASIVGGRGARSGVERDAAVDAEPASSPSTPVNVTEKLGLDPAPVATPKPVRKAPAKKPTTKIDAAADPGQVDATPADVAKAVDKEPPA